ncbi:MAG: response regulator [Brevinematales bacterium]|nr:response regulator [Brevinematales bacterium]
MSDRKTVLIIDDTPLNIKILSDALKDEYRILVAPNGERGLELARGENTPDVILLDIMMPGMDGFEVCRRLKADGATSGIPVMFITAMEKGADEKKGRELGAADFILKPFSIPDLKKRISKIIH